MALIVGGYKMTINTSSLAGGIKSVQRGTNAFTGSTLNVAISEVDMDKTMINLLTTTAAYNQGGTNNSAFIKYELYITLVSPTRLDIKGDNVTSLNTVCSWEVVEYA
jgi:hypothetical protein